ncbi:MAG: AMP-binding protein [Gammaproteobacteria bacterium]
MAKLPMGELIGMLAAEAPDAPAVTLGDTTVTRRALDLRTNRLARAYAALGVEQDRLVTIALPNSIGFIEACIACWKLGATPQPVSDRMPERERSEIIELADPALIVGASAQAHPGRRSVPADFRPDPGLGDAALPPRIARYWRAPTTGGSTGRPKIVLSNAPSVADPDEITMRLGGGGCELVAAPLYYGGPLMYATFGLMRRKHLVIMPRFDAVETLRLIQRWRADWVMLVPTMMARIWRLDEAVRGGFDLSSLQTVLHMAAACPVWLKQAWIDWLGPDRIYELYSGMETSGMTWISGRQWLAHQGSVGRPIRGCEMRILDESGAEMPRGEIGEIFMRLTGAAEPAYRYIGAEARERGGWQSLGDLGHMDADGYLYIADRRVDMILSGGANVYPAQIEAALDEHPRIIASAVIGLPDDDMGNRVHAIYHAESPIPDEELRAHAAERLSPYKIPRSFEFSAAPLRDEAGKLRRGALRAERIAAQGGAAPT